MGITLLCGCGQVEISVRNMQRAGAFMQDVLGAEKIEERLASEITALFPGGELTVVHYDCGEAVFQFNQPSPAASYLG